MGRRPPARRRARAPSRRSAARISSASTLFRSVGRSIAASAENKGRPAGMQPKHSAASLLTSAALCETSSLACLLAAAAASALAQGTAPAATPVSTAATSLLAPGEEKHLANVRQLTFGGQNAEAYWSADGTRLIFQSDEGTLPCDQIFTMKADGSRSPPRLQRRGQDHLLLLLPLGRPRALRVDVPREPGVPAPARTARTGTSGRSTTTTSTRPGPTAPTSRRSSPRRGTTPRPPSRPTARPSSSRRRATATSSSTR